MRVDESTRVRSAWVRVLTERTPLVAGGDDPQQQHRRAKVVEGALGDILGKAYAQLSTMLSEAVDEVMEWFNKYVVDRVSASFQSLLAWFANQLGNLLNPINIASQKAGELATAASTAGSNVLSALNPLNWFGVVENPHFRQWVLDNPEFGNHLVSIEEVEEEVEGEEVGGEEVEEKEGTAETSSEKAETSAGE